MNESFDHVPRPSGCGVRFFEYSVRVPMVNGTPPDIRRSATGSTRPRWRAVWQNSQRATLAR